MMRHCSYSAYRIAVTGESADCSSLPHSVIRATWQHMHLAGGELQHAHSIVFVFAPGSQEGGVRAEFALTACSEYILLLLV
jgi:hypothetical protein